MFKKNLKRLLKLKISKIIFENKLSFASRYENFKLKITKKKITNLESFQFFLFF